MEEEEEEEEEGDDDDILLLVFIAVFFGSITVFDSAFWEQTTTIFAENVEKIIIASASSITIATG